MLYFSKEEHTFRNSMQRPDYSERDCRNFKERGLVNPGRRKCLVCKKVIYPLESGISLFTWPTDDRRRAQFCTSMNVPISEIPRFDTSRQTKICSIHFDDSQYKALSHRRLPKKDCLPTLFPRPSESIKCKPEP